MCCGPQFCAVDFRDVCAGLNEVFCWLQWGMPWLKLGCALVRVSDTVVLSEVCCGSVRFGSEWSVLCDTVLCGLFQGCV